MASPIAPWHMWGNSVTQSLTLGAPTPANSQTSQLIRVGYRRPETWRFWFWGRLLGGSTPAAAQTSVHVMFDIYIGIGRSVMRSERALATVVPTECFLNLHWLVPVGTTVGSQPNNVKYASRIPGPVLDDSGTDQFEIDLVTAEDIQCRGRAFINSGDAGATAQVEFGCFFAPNTHVRPDWMARRDQFLGGETGGT